MTVRKPQRTTSTFEVRDNATQLCNRIIVLSYSNFGIEIKEESDDVGEWKLTEDKNIDIHAAVKTNKPDVSGASLILEFERNGKVFLKSYKTWLIAHYKEELWKYAQDLSYHIRAANTINPILKREYEERRLHQDYAMACCMHLLDLLTQTKEILHVKATHVDSIIDLLHSERRLIHEWRKSDYKKLSGCLKREKKLNLQAIESLKNDFGRAIKKKKSLQDPKIRDLLVMIEDVIDTMKKSINEVPEGKPVCLVEDTDKKQEDLVSDSAVTENKSKH